MKRRSLLLAAPLGWSLANIALAQSAYPSKTIRYIVPVSAGRLAVTVPSAPATV